MKRVLKRYSHISKTRLRNLRASSDACRLISSLSPESLKP